MGQTLADHSYVDISQVGNDVNGGSDTVQCHTDLDSCCRAEQGSHRGDWYFPNGERLPFPGGSPIIEFRTAQRVDLRRTNPSAMGPTGIYRCEIPTDDSPDIREIIHLGLYTSDGGKVIMMFTIGENSVGSIRYSNVGEITIVGDEVTFDSDQLTLTCNSTGGPATTVTWTRDSTTVPTGTQRVLNDEQMARYTHTLTVTTGGVYTCTVENNKPSSDSATIILGGIYIYLSVRI